ncbi:MAG: succinate dehydrogenase, cytochrome b556 subunit [Nevskia sp.]|nr:succinate dehydrogenase, cytochrome b556 subunit [Nevskia sp.]
MSAKSSAERAAARPLSPFMLGQYYRFQISSLLSITHRITGVGLALGTLFLAAWLMSAATGPAAYQRFAACARSPIGLILLLGWSWSLLYHLCNGVRHLVWDAGYAFEKKNVDAGGWAVVIGSVVLTAAVWLTAYI